MHSIPTLFDFFSPHLSSWWIDSLVFAIIGAREAMLDPENFIVSGWSRLHGESKLPTELIYFTFDYRSDVKNFLVPNSSGIPFPLFPRPDLEPELTKHKHIYIFRDAAAS